VLNVAIVGCGRMGRVHAERIRDDGRARVAAVFDTVPDVARTLRDDLGPEATLHDDLTGLLGATDLDAAIIGTPTSLHFEQVVACLDRGLHVLCEKPLADTRPRIVELIDRSRADGGPVLMIGYQRRFWATYRTLRREVLSGDWGPVRAVTFHNVEDWQQTIAGTWRDDPAINWGGFVGDRGSHEIDGLLHLTGLVPREVFARVWNQGSRVPITATIAAVLAGANDEDVPLSLDFVGHGQYRGEDLTIHCERADWMLRGPVQAGQEVWLGREGTMCRVDDLDPGTNPVVGFLDVLLDGAENVAPAACALAVYDFTAAILESARRGTSVLTG
jgi:predicted dehydrogenase